MRPLIFFLCLLSPQILEASVLITEVAWMGSSGNANHEWIELYNSGSSADLTGWTLGDGGSLSIALYGTLGASQYAVLERTSDDSAPGAAYSIYTGALVNTGTTLTLRDSNGAVVDSVIGGDGWQNIGGSNTTKETPQRSSSGWSTAIATAGSGSYPGSAAPPAPLPVVADTSPSVSSQSASNGGGGSGLVKSAPVTAKIFYIEPRTLFVDIEASALGYVNQPVTMQAVGSGVSKTITQSLVHTWNFGDLQTGVGKKVTHTFAAPGKYIVLVSSRFGEYAATQKHQIEIKPVPIKVSRVDKAIVLHNEASYEVDISNFVLVGKSTMSIPDHSWLLPGQSVSISVDKVAAANTDVIALYDSTGALAYASAPVEPRPVVRPPVATRYAGVVNAPATSKVVAPPTLVAPLAYIPPPLWPPTGFVLGAATSTKDTGVVSSVSAAPLTSGGGATVPYAYWGLLGVMLVGIVSILSGKKP